MPILFALAHALGLFAACRSDPDCTGDDCTVRFDAGTTGRRDGGDADGAADGAIDLDGAAPDARPPLDGGPFSVTVGQPGRTLIAGEAVLTMAGAVHAPGEVYVEGNRIRCVGPRNSCATQAAGATVIESGGIVLPALIDAHNHPAYNWLPEWESGQLWNDSPQWRGSTAYNDFTAAYSANSDDRVRFCAMVQWGELRALMSGTTAILGVGQPRTCYRWLVRNTELTTGYNGWPRDQVRSNSLGIDQVDATEAASLISQMDAGQVSAYAIHIAEGLTQRSRDEYTQLKTLGLLRAQTVLIHATALEAPDFAEVAAAGAKIVWSPSSNFALYGATTDVAAALAAGVTVALAPDWTPSGADDLLQELRWVDAYARDNLPGLLSDSDLVEMVTLIPARIFGLENLVGSLAVDHLADILVLSAPAAEPYRAVVTARPEQVRLVLLDGLPSYGDRALMRLLPDAPPGCYDLEACGAEKRGCWNDSPDGPVDPATVRDVITGFYAPGPLALAACD